MDIPPEIRILSPTSHNLGSAMTTPSHKEKLLSGLGGGVSIFIVFALTFVTEQELQTHLLLIASMGASAVLLFAVPHSPLSQPWNVIGGHVISALIGTLMHWLISDIVVAGALAAGLAITAMYYLGCLHPPGGASAVIPVISGSAASDYGLGLVFFPIGIGAVVMVLVAIAYNYPFAWRRYPLSLWSRMRPPQATQHVDGYPDISHADFVAALAEIDTYVDISEEDLLRIYNIAARKDAESRA